ncbi:MAG: hypothetical protein AAGB04_20470 [Pseudomonadota bacterium]
MGKWWGVIAAAAAASVVAMVVAAGGDDRSLSMAAATGFAAVMIIAALRLNLLTLRNSDVGSYRADASTLNAGLLAAAFIWGGLVILASYYLTNLFWHHAWQYGLGMCIAGLLSYGIGWHMARPDCFLRAPHWLQRMSWLSGLLLIATAVGLVFLVVSGKLARNNVDWIANHVFVAGGATVMAVSAIAVWAQLGARR